MSALSGCFFFLFPYCPDLFGKEGTKLKATDQGRTSTSQIDNAIATTSLADILYWYFFLVPAKCTKFREVSLIERFQQALTWKKGHQISDLSVLDIISFLKKYEPFKMSG